jgi:hypothetical protein
MILPVNGSYRLTGIATVKWQSAKDANPRSSKYANLFAVFRFTTVIWGGFGL